MTSRRASALLAAALTALFGAVHARAHVDNADGLSLQLLGAQPVEGGVELALVLKNATGAAVTLRGMSTAAGAPVRLERRRSLFGYETWAPVDFLRVETGKTVLISPPDYRAIAASGEREDFLPHEPVMRANFGPRGMLDVEGFGGGGGF